MLPDGTAIFYYSGMRAAVAFCLLCAFPAVSWSASPEVQTASRVPSVTIQFAGKDHGNYKFTIHNSSGHGVTAFDVLLVPSGVSKKNGHFLCRGRCSNSTKIGDIDQPAIAAGATADVSYEIATVTEGAVFVEAAVFDDETYAGSERTAALLIANQLGYQAEFDRIVSAVDNIMAESGPQNAGKGSQIDSTLSGLTVDADNEQMAAFYRWFPNIRDCSHLFPQIMQGAASQVKTGVQGTLQPLSASGSVSDAALTQWWGTTKHYLDGFGCVGCADKMAAPSPPVQPYTVSLRCGGATSGGALLADNSLADDDGSVDGADQSASNDADGGTAPDQAGDAPSKTEEAADSRAAAVPTTTRSPMDSSTDTDSVSSPVLPRCRPMAPRPLASLGLAGGGDPSQAPLRPVTNEQIYPRYFRYVEGWDRCLADGQWPDSTVEQFPDPYPPGMNGDQRGIIRSVALDWVQVQRESATQTPVTGVGIRLQSSARATTWAEAQQGLSTRQRLADEREQRAKLIESRLQGLRLALGKTSFRALDDYAHDLYHATPGKWARQPLPESTMYVRYVHRIGLMDKFAGNGDEDGHAAARARAEEQTACGLTDADEQVLQHEADLAGKLNQPRPSSAGTIAATGPDVPSSVRAVPSEERTRMAEALVKRLRAGLSRAGFQSVEKRVHALYESDGIDRVVPATEPKSKPGETQALVPQQR